MQDRAVLRSLERGQQLRFLGIFVSKQTRGIRSVRCKHHMIESLTLSIGQCDTRQTRFSVHPNHFGVSVHIGT